MQYRCKTEGWSSTFSFMTRAGPAYCSAIASTTGSSVRHGPHHGAQKSTNTSFPDCKTAWSKSLSLSSLTYSLMSFSSEDLFYDCFVHASFGDKLGSLPIHLNQEIPSFIVNKCYRA